MFILRAGRCRASGPLCRPEPILNPTSEMPGQVAPIVLAHAYKAVPQIPSSKLISVHNLKGQLLAAIEFSNTTAATLETEYTHSVRHFLLIGTLAMFLGAIVFGFMAIKSNHKITVYAKRTTIQINIDTEICSRRLLRSSSQLLRPDPTT